MRRDTPITNYTVVQRWTHRVGDIIRIDNLEGTQYLLVTAVSPGSISGRPVSRWFVRWQGVKGWCNRVVCGAIERVKLL